MNCFVYKGSKKQDHFLFLRDQLDGEDSPDIPEALLTMLGDLSLVVEFELTQDRELPQADARQVLSDLESRGYYLQMPKHDRRALEDQWFN